MNSRKSKGINVEKNNNRFKRLKKNLNWEKKKRKKEKGKPAQNCKNSM